MKTILFCSITLFLLSTSCKKNGTITTTTPPPPPVLPVPVVLEKFYEIDTTLIAPKDTVVKYLITYDVSGRAISVADYEFYPNGDTSFYYIEKHTYSGTDTTATKTTSVEKDFSTAIPKFYYDTIYHVFSNGRNIKDSLLNGANSYTLIKHTYLPNGNIAQSETAYTTNTVIHDNSSVYYLTKSNSSIVNQVDTTKEINYPLSPGVIQYTRYETTVSYLANPNPLNKVVMPIKQEHFDHRNAGSYEYFAAAPTTLIQQKTDDTKWWGVSGSGSQTKQISYAYTFRSDGYPLIARRTVITNGVASKQHKFLYFYK